MTSAAAKTSATSRENSETRERHDLGAGDRSGNLGRLVEHSRSDRPCGPLGMSQQLFGRDHDVAARGTRAFDGSGGRRCGPSAAERGSTRVLRGRPVARRRSRRRRGPACLPSRGERRAPRRGAAPPRRPAGSLPIRSRRSTAARRADEIGGPIGPLRRLHGPPPAVDGAPTARGATAPRRAGRSRGARTIAHRSSPLVRQASRVTGPGGLLHADSALSSRRAISCSA